MTISRGQMPRQLYLGGGITQLPMDQMMVPRGQYGLGSLVKSITKPIKKAASAIGDFAKSDIGKIALLAAGAYFAPVAFGQQAGFANFGNLVKTGLVGAPTNLITGEAAKAGLLGTGGVFAPSVGSIATTLAGPKGFTGISSLIPSKGAAIAAIGGGLLSSLFGGPKEAKAAFSRDPEGVKNYLIQYFKNLNKDATDEEARAFAESQTREYAASGGRIGFEDGGTYKEFEQFMRDIQESEKEQTKQRLLEMFKQYQRRKKGNVVEAAEGGIMGLPMGEMRENKAGVMERDYREEGGFVPVGIKEKADDVPAMLSKNEFVFTADAVRGAGDGDVEKGAQRLYNTMKTLENGGTV